MTIIADIKEGVNLVSFAYTEDDYGARTNTGSTVSATNAVIVLLTSDDETVKSGVLNVGDARGYFDPNDESSIKAGVIVEYQSRSYEIAGEPRKYSLGGTANHIEADLKRFHKP